MKEPMIVAQGLTKAFYDGKNVSVVIDDVSFEVAKGEMIAIMGPSGSGKSVLLNMLGGVLPISAGSLTMNGVEINGIVDKKTKADIGYAFQIDNLMPWRTVRKNLLLPIETYKKKLDQDPEERMHWALKIVGLDEYAAVYPHELSGGMRQRASFARSIMHDPKMLILDQPFGALDAITRSMMGYQLLNILRDSDKCGVIATNDFKEAVLLASRVMFLSKNGKVENVVDIDIPYEERDENIIERPGVEELIRELRSVFDALSGDEEVEI